MRTPIMLVVVLVALALAVTAGTAFAQESAPAGDDAGTTSLGQIITGGGVIGYVIILLSIISLALAIEHFVTVRRD